MKNTLPSKKRTGHESAVGMQRHKRTATDVGLALITPIVGQEFLDRHHLRDPLNRGLKLRHQDKRSPPRAHRRVSSSGFKASARRRPGSRRAAGTTST